MKASIALGFILAELVWLTSALQIRTATGGLKSNTIRPLQRGTTTLIPDFKELLQCTTFVDKTMLIADLFNNSAAREYQLITCPSKFGRSINLDMIKRFVEGNVNIQGHHKQSNLTTYKMFRESNRNLKITPLLDQTSQFFIDNFQQYAVIHVSFKVKDAQSYDDVLNKLCCNFHAAFEPFRKFYNDVRERYPVTPEVEGTYACMERGLMNSIIWLKTHILNSLFELAKFIHPFSKIFLLIDDYDDPIIQAIEHNFDVNEVYRLIDGVFSLLFSPRHRYINQALITGSLNIFDESKFAFVKHWGFLDNHHLTPYFGLMENEVNQLLESHGVCEDERDAVKQYYSGYHVSDSSLKIYNPYSIANYLCNRNPNYVQMQLENYWGRIITTSNFFHNLKQNKVYRKLITEVLELKSFTFSLKECWTYKDLEEVQAITRSRCVDLTKYRVDLILSYLFHNGYFSFGNEPNTYCVPDNEEVRACWNAFVEKDEKAEKKKSAEEPNYQHVTRKKDT